MHQQEHICIKKSAEAYCKKKVPISCVCKPSHKHFALITSGFSSSSLDFLDCVNIKLQFLNNAPVRFLCT